METIEASFEVDFPDGKKTVNATLKHGYEIEDCEVGKAVFLNLRNGETHSGIFRGAEGDESFSIYSFSGEYRLGYKTGWVETYFEEKKEEDVQ